MYLIVRSDRLSFAYTHEERGMMPQYDTSDLEEVVMLGSPNILIYRKVST